MARTCEEDRNWELGRIGAGEVELGNQIRGLGLGQPQLCSEAGTRPHAAPVLATLRVTLAPLSPSESSDLEHEGICY